MATLPSDASEFLYEEGAQPAMTILCGDLHANVAVRWVAVEHQPTCRDHLRVHLDREVADRLEAGRRCRSAGSKERGTGG
jgi:hypothetical protein